MRERHLPQLVTTITAAALIAVVAIPAATTQAAPSTPAPTAPTTSGQPGEPTPGHPVISTVAPGVQLEQHAYGEQDAQDHWAVHVYLPTDASHDLSKAPTALATRPIADHVATELRIAGFSPAITEVRTPDYADYADKSLGWVVRVGAYDTEQAANEQLAAIKAAGFTGGLRLTSQDGSDPGAEQRAFVMRVDLDEFDGTVEANHGDTLSGTEPITTLLEQAGAIGGINGQWFYDKAPGGLYVKDGKILSTATQGRGGVRITGGGTEVDVDTYTAELTLVVDGENVELDAINRLPGRIFNCGGVGGDTPTQHPQHDLRCSDDSELVRFTPEWGTAPTGAGAEAVLDRDHRVTAINSSRGAAVPADGSTVQAIGDQADWLLENLSVGQDLDLRETVRDSSGRRVNLGRTTTIIQPGPTLIKDGKIDVNAYADGLIREGVDKTFTYNWAIRSNPRTMFGKDAEGRLMLVVVDGRQTGWSEGLSVIETAQMMQDLGAVEAVNFDGGGSSVMATAADGILNRPSDASGQRSLGNTVLIMPRQR